MKIVKNGVMLGVVLVCISFSCSLQANTRIFPTCTGIYSSIKGTSVNFRNYPSKYGKVLEVIDNENIRILGKNNNWYKVDIDGTKGWIHGDFVCDENQDFIPYTKILGEEIVDYGKQFIGTPYIWGGEDLKSGVDCSGLTQKVYEGFNINISRVSYQQIRDGRLVNKEELQPGDLVFFDTTGNNNGQISHVGIFIKEDKFLHADSTHGVMISSLNSNYYTTNYVGGCRILNY